MATGADIATGLELRRDVRVLMADPDLTGDLLLVALALCDYLYERRDGTGVKSAKRTNWVQGIADRTGIRANYVPHVIGKDFPRYEPENWTDHAATLCRAPMVRRNGPCGQRATMWTLDFDPKTGRRWRAGACTRHRATEMPAIDARRRAWIANGGPTPPHNAGGILARHFAGKWDDIYAWAAPHEARRATPGTGKAPTPPKPTLRLIVGGA